MNKDLKITKGMKNFLQNDVLPNYIIYSKKDKYAFCTYCQHEVEIDFKNTKPKMVVTCPSCKREAFLKAKGQTKYSFFDYGGGFILDKDNGEVCVRYFDVYKYYNADGTVKDFSTHECLREYFDKNGYKVGYDKYTYGDWRKLNIRKYANYRGCEGEPCYHINPNWNIRAVYKGNLKSVIKGTPWEYSCLDKIFKMPDPHCYWNTLRVYLLDYLQCPIDEYLYKVGFKELCSYSVFVGGLPIDIKAKSLPDMLKVNKENYKALLKVGNPDRQTLIKYQTMTKYHLSELEYKIFAKFFEEKDYYYNHSSDKNTQYEEFMKIFPKSLYKLDKYVDTQKDFDIKEYKDYLEICLKLKYDISNTFVLFPKYFTKEHQNVIEKWNEKMNRKARASARRKNDVYAKVTKEYSEKYSFEQGNLKIVIPQDAEQICIEGQRLHHCVGTYIDRVCKGSSIILFVRRIDDLDVSFYTMEIQGDRFVQCRGFSNRTMTDEVKNFVNDFAKQKKIKVA